MSSLAARQGERLSFGRMAESGEPATFDLEALIGSRLLVSMNSGGGKSYLIRKLLEVSHGKVQQVVIDLEGEFPTLREKFDYLLVSSKGGDVRLDVRTADLLARTVLENPGTSVILDLSELKDQERKHYVRLFLDSMIAAPRELWHPVVVVIDEAHHFDPEGQEAESSPAVNDLMTRGRKRGFCGWLATQRLSKLNKDAAAEANNVMVGRTTLDIDQKRASDILGFTTKDQTRSLRDLEPGQFYAFGPALSPGVNLVKGGQVATTHPKVGMEGLVTVPPPASERIKSVLSRFAEVNPERAEVDVRDRQEAARTIRELQHKVRVLESADGRMSPEVREVIEKGAFAMGEANAERRLSAEVKKLRDLASWNLRVARKALTLAGEMSSELKEVPEPEVMRPSSGPSPSGRQLTETPSYLKGTTLTVRIRDPGPEARREAARTPLPLDGDDQRPLKEGALRMVRAAAQFHLYLGRPISRLQMSVLSGLSVDGGGFKDYLSLLKRRGYLEERSEEDIRPTKEGLELAGDVPELPTEPMELARAWAQRFKKGCGEMLLYVVERGGEWVTKDEVAQAVGLTTSGGGFKDYLSLLRRNGLVEVRDSEVRAGPAIMLEVQP